MQRLLAFATDTVAGVDDGAVTGVAVVNVFAIANAVNVAAVVAAVNPLPGGLYRICIIHCMSNAEIAPGMSKTCSSNDKQFLTSRGFDMQFQKWN